MEAKGQDRAAEVSRGGLVDRSQWFGVTAARMTHRIVEVCVGRAIVPEVVVSKLATIKKTLK